MKYAFVRAHRNEFSIKRMCQVLEVSRSGYYDWQGRKDCARSQRDCTLLDEIRKIHRDTKEAYGAVKTWRALKDAGIGCGKHRVARLRRLAAIDAAYNEELTQAGRLQIAIVVERSLPLH